MKLKKYKKKTPLTYISRELVIIICALIMDILNKEKYRIIKKLWVNQNIIFSSDELKLLAEKGFKYIPREYFGQELKEAAE